MTIVRILIQDLDKKFDREGYQFFTSDWSLPRKHVYTYLTEAEGYGAAEEAFHIFNAPLEMLEEWQQYIEQTNDARMRANLAKVKLEEIRMRYGEWNNGQANMRAEMKL